MDDDLIPIEDDDVDPNMCAEYEPEYRIEHEILDFINNKLKFDLWKKTGGRCVGCIGECASVQYVGGVGHYNANLTIWDRKFNNAKLLVNWLNEFGVAFVDSVLVQKYNSFDISPDKAKFKEDHHRIWIVDFYLKNHQCCKEEYLDPF